MVPIPNWNLSLAFLDAPGRNKRFVSAVDFGSENCLGFENDKVLVPQQIGDQIFHVDA